MYSMKVYRATSSQAIASAAITTLIWNTVDAGYPSGDFNTTTGTWTCPKTGYYNLFATVQTSSITAGEAVQLRITVNSITVGTLVYAAISSGNIETVTANQVYVVAGQTAIVTVDSTADTSYNFDNNTSAFWTIQETPFSNTTINTGPYYIGTETWTDDQTNATTQVNLYRSGSFLRVLGTMSFTGAFSGTECNVTIPAAYTINSSTYPNIATLRPYIGPCTLNDSGANYPGLIFPTSTTNLRIAATNSSTTYATTTNLTSTIPFTWASGDAIFFDISYVVSGW